MTRQGSPKSRTRKKPAALACRRAAAADADRRRAIDLLSDPAQETTEHLAGLHVGLVHSEIGEHVSDVLTAIVPA